MATAFELTEAREMLELWKACERELATGQAKEYTVGSRTFKAVDLPEIAKRITYYKNMVEVLTHTARAARTARVVPRDL